MTFRHPQLLALAKESPRCFVCMKTNDGTVLPAHSNRSAHGKGLGNRASDLFWAAACRACHHEIDQGMGPQADREAMWERGFIRTWTWLWETGRVAVAAEPVEHINPAKPRSRKIAGGKKLQSSRQWPPGRKLVSRKFDPRQK